MISVFFFEFIYIITLFCYYIFKDSDDDGNILSIFFVFYNIFFYGMVDGSWMQTFSTKKIC